MPVITDYFPADISRSSLLAAQRLVSERAVVKDAFNELHCIAGVDQAFPDERIISGIVVLDQSSFKVVECVHSIRPVSFPYIPTFLSFREGPAIVEAFKELKTLPDMLLVDGAGIKPSPQGRYRHPYRRCAGCAHDRDNKKDTVR